MSLNPLPLSYCTNVHPGRSVAEVEAGLDQYTVAVARGVGRPIAAGLWLAKSVVAELLATGGAVPRFADGLRRRELPCYTLNAFPYGDFHSPRVKERVYLPDWTAPERLQYTVQCATVLAALLPAGGEGSISTVPLGFKGFSHAPDFADRAADQLIECARGLRRIAEETGKVVRLAIEPEPLCVLETTAEAIEFFRRVWERADRGAVADAARTHLGVCYDVCHQAVEFEDVGASIRQLAAAGVRINKVHASCAIEVDRPVENLAARQALRRYVEPRYLHQTIATSAGGIVRAVDLTEELADSPPADFAAADAWRVHFHVPVDAERLGPLRTTRPALRQALRAVAELPYAPHLEVETYTWEVLPDAQKTDLVAGLTREMAATHAMLAAVGGERVGG